ncbi:THO complex subunit 7 protein [Fasciolopsis buskii]|uniref:THO complex subunit 7 protein n=1 Tax=Fasciolopsis buskii TaxID=27845 RepID=A0A8E0RVL4_9TREM|nr:THO complex subunit 7 protein [Fasciolopsis buski]
MSTISDDEIIKRKLLIEGESGNDDRRITLLLKNYLRWIASTDVGSEGSDAFQALIGSVYQCENSMEQAALVLNMNGEQQKQYTELFKDIENQMENARKRIEECKDELGTAKVIRKNRRGMKLV